MVIVVTMVVVMDNEIIRDTMIKICIEDYLDKTIGFRITTDVMDPIIVLTHVRVEIIYCQLGIILSILLIGVMNY